MSLKLMHCFIDVIRKEKALLADNANPFQNLKSPHANPTCFQVLQRQIPVCSADANHPQFVFSYFDSDYITAFFF